MQGSIHKFLLVPTALLETQTMSRRQGATCRCWCLIGLGETMAWLNPWDSLRLPTNLACSRNGTLWNFPVTLPNGKASRTQKGQNQHLRRDGKDTRRCRPGKNDRNNDCKIYGTTLIWFVLWVLVILGGFIVICKFCFIYLFVNLFITKRKLPSS